MEFYQVEKGEDKVDLQKINFALRRIFELIANLQADRATIKFRGPIDLGGNRITGGPVSQATAEETEFITKGYCSSVEMARIIVRIIGQSGKVPLPPSS